MRLPLRSIQVGLLSFGSIVLFALAIPTTVSAAGENCYKISGTCEIPCSTGNRPALSTEFAPGASNDCPKDTALGLTQYCCVAQGVGYECKAAGGSCDSGTTCGVGKVDIGFDCGAGKSCCKSSGGGGAASAATAAEGCVLGGGTCRKDCKVTGEETTFSCEDGNFCCMPAGTSKGDAGSGTGGTGSGGTGTGGSTGGTGTPTDTGASTLNADEIACGSKGGTCKTSCDTKTEQILSSCNNAAKQVCCLVKKTSTAASGSGLSPIAAPAFRLTLPACISDGNCQLSDIVDTGANAANFFTTLSAALFFLSFVYGGARYLLSFGRKEWVTAGTKAMTTSALGMAIVMLAWVIVNYVANAVQGKA